MAPRPWLAPDDYARLSPMEKNKLRLEREQKRRVERHGRTYRRCRKRMPYWQRKLIPVLMVMVAIPAVGWVSDHTPSVSRDDVALMAAGSPSGGERVHFGLCVWGGGTNCVVDGDTIYLHRQKIRIAGIDAPETHDFKCPSEKSLGDRATNRLRELLNAGTLTLSSIDRDEDAYGRKLRNVAVDGEDVGDTLVGEGLARPYRGHKMAWC